MDLYRLEHIVHAYAGRPVLTIDRLSLPANVILGLCGPNGSGKSTLLRLLGFVERPDSGTILFNGRAAAPFDHRVRGAVALVPQTAYLLRRSVYHNVAYGLRINGRGRDEAERVRDALTMVGLDPDSFARRPWFALSGGEARRVALAARLVLRPRVLLMDEPTTSVDAASAHLIKEAALQAHRLWGAGLVVASHDRPWLQDICDDTLHLYKGKVLGRGQPTLLFGPWQRRADGLPAMPLGADQFFIGATAPAPMEKAVAALDARCLSLYTTAAEIPAHQTCLQGTITALSLDKSLDRISVSVAVGHVLFTADVPRETLSGGRFIPGNEVWIAYAPEEVSWY